MPVGFRASLEPPAHRRVSLDKRRPCCCLVLTSGVLVFLFLVFGLSSWNLYAHQYDVIEHRYNDGDQVALAEVSKDFSSIFCDSYNVTLGDTGSVYLLSHQAAVNTSERLVESFALERDLDDDFTVREFYLLHNSQLHLVACRENGSQPLATRMLFVKGRDKLRQWRRDQLCKDCVFMRMVIPDDVICSEDTNDPPYTFSIPVRETDDYAIIVDYSLHTDRPLEDNNKVIINVTLVRTLFELRDPRINCSYASESESESEFAFDGKRKGESRSLTCKFGLPFNADYDVVVDFSGDVKKEYHGSSDASRKFDTRCSIRLAFWIFVFAGVPLVLAALASSAFFWFLCRNRSKSEVKRLSSRSEVKVQDDASLVSNEVGVAVRIGGGVEEDSCMAIQDA